MVQYKLLQVNEKIIFTKTAWSYTIDAKVGSFYGKPQKSIHMRNVICSGHESTLTQCSYTQLSVSEGKLLDTNVAGVDCTGMSTTAPCLTNHDIISNTTCNSQGSIRLIHNDIESSSEGRVEYCTGVYWTPLCNMDNRVATVICRQMGYTQYEREHILKQLNKEIFQLFYRGSCV